jgi:hypothetical protein
MSAREEFSLEDEYESGGEEDLDKLLGGVERRPKPGKRTQQAAWSRVEDALEERRLKRELSDFLDEEA